MFGFFFANSGKWELGELETDGALDGDIGLIMSVRDLHLPCVCSFMFQFLVSIASCQALCHRCQAGSTFQLSGHRDSSSPVSLFLSLSLPFSLPPLFFLSFLMV